MPITYVCDICGRTIVPENIRYEVKIEIKAAYDQLDITEEDLKKDITGEIKELLRKIDEVNSSELHDDIHKVLRFDLCRPCQKRFIMNPLPCFPRSATTS